MGGSHFVAIPYAKRKLAPRLFSLMAQNENKLPPLL